MKKYNFMFAIMVMVIGIPSLFISCNKDEEVKLDFTITVPENWRSYVVANEGLVYTAERSPVDEQDSITEKCYIVKEAFAGYNLSSFYNTLRPILLGLDSHKSVIRETDTVINSINYKKMVSSETLEMYNLQRDTFEIDVITDRYFFFNKDYGYNLVLISVDSLYYGQNKAIFNQIIGTLEFKE